ncbi:hypothetical protein ACFFSW_04470 [Saccharothrix longispora]|uniref:Uncharacterized protein n=1 Tax=Saccharothrix longispora TaxID=33920 RepID=A0ABU1PN04_9PSEU|nr:hypothetical protein [Saccharothrix longispora]MDR6592005.1 hypothetical protein [Saccharothrix longispora]
MPLPWSKRYKVKCRDGSVKYVHRDVDDAFPLELRESGKRTAAGLDVLQQVSGNLERSHVEQIKAALFSLNQANDTMMVNFRALYTVYQTDPCANAGYLAAGTQALMAEHQRTKDLVIRLDALLKMAQTDQQVVGEVLKVITGLPGFADEAARVAIRTNRQAAHEWLETAPAPGEVEN